MIKKIVIANWKMNPLTPGEAKVISKGIVKASDKLKRTTVVIAPPFPFLSSVSLSKKVFLGSQDAFWGGVGAQTGEVSIGMLKSLKASYVILGHSERRALGESDAFVSKKIIATLKAGMTPILCIGEKARDHHGDYLSFVENQIRASLEGVSRKEISKIIIAYEPVWAIGKTADDAMDSSKLHEMSIFVHKTLVNMFGRESAQKVKLNYGGSVEGANAHDLIQNGNVYGFLVGHASLDSKKFAEILRATDK